MALHRQPVRQGPSVTRNPYSDRSHHKMSEDTHTVSTVHTEGTGNQPGGRGRLGTEGTDRQGALSTVHTEGTDNQSRGRVRGTDNQNRQPDRQMAHIVGLCIQRAQTTSQIGGTQ